MVRGDECTECRLEEVAAEYRRKMLDEGKNFYLVQLEYETTDLGSPANVDENDPIVVLYKERCKYAQRQVNVGRLGRAGQQKSRRSTANNERWGA